MEIVIWQGVSPESGPSFFCSALGWLQLQTHFSMKNQQQFLTTSFRDLANWVKFLWFGHMIAIKC